MESAQTGSIAKSRMPFPPSKVKIKGRAGFLMILVGIAAMVGQLAAQATKPRKWDGSRVTPVHRIPLKDEFNQPIVPTESYPLPFSSRYTCEPCHEYDVIKQGLHFDASTAEKAGRPGEPWVWVDERTGTLLPLSRHSWKGTWNPADLGLTAWDMTLLFGRHMAGGGVAEPGEKEVTPESRWNVSGRIEINCLGCHNATNLQNPSEWAKQILRQNFRWAATAAAGLGEVGGMSSRLGPTWDIFDGPNPDDSEWAVAPFVKYDRTLFDNRHRAYLDISYKPDDSRCLACHATSPSNMKKSDFDEDVHTAAGISCVSCHRHDIRHNMIRGYEGEAADNPAILSDDFTCRACHLGSESSGGEKILAGRLGAPYPRHRGIPAVHFERLECTVCHSGPLPTKSATRVRTSRANRLGIYGVANWTTELPAILEPIYIRNENQKLTPCRLMWPAFWGERKGDRIIPLRPDRVLEAAGNVLFPERAVTQVLAALLNVPDLEGIPVWIMGGRAYELNLDGGLDVSPAQRQETAPAKSGGSAARPTKYTWGVKSEGKISPLVPEFDPASSEEAAGAEPKIQKILEALTLPEVSPAKPCLGYKGFFYRIVENSLEKSERKDLMSPEPELFWFKDDRLLPLVPESSLRPIAALSGTEFRLTEEQVELGLKALAERDPAGTPDDAWGYVYISGGKLFQLDKRGKLEATNDGAAAPVAWPLAHEVRPARQSLGIGGCKDCHTAKSDFFFARIEGSGPLRTERVSVRPAVSFMGLAYPYQKLFGLSFSARPAFKAALFIAAFLVGFLLLVAGGLALARHTGLIEKRK
jgi:hypothetical protein